VPPPTKRTAMANSNGGEKTVSVKEAAIENGNGGLFLGNKLPV